tara:strand:+ start:304 stop:456 length:153 start_codon:yes stop_codon:yes gene_type:complete
MYLIVDKQSGKEATVEVDGFDRKKMIEKFNQQTGLNVSPTKVGHIKILPI